MQPPASPESMERPRVQALGTAQAPAEQRAPSPQVDHGGELALAVGSIIGNRYVIEQHIRRSAPAGASTSPKKVYVSGVNIGGEGPDAVCRDYDPKAPNAWPLHTRWSSRVATSALVRATT